VDGETVLAETAESYRNALGERLIAAYALGSLAHGGFSPLVSDIDLGLIVSDPVRLEDAETIQAIADREKAKGSPLHKRISVFWGTPSTLAARALGAVFRRLIAWTSSRADGRCSAATRRAPACRVQAPMSCS